MNLTISGWMMWMSHQYPQAVEAPYQVLLQVVLITMPITVMESNFMTHFEGLVNLLIYDGVLLNELLHTLLASVIVVIYIAMVITLLNM